MSAKYICVALLALAACVTALDAEEKEQFIAAVAPIIGQCAQEYKVAPQDIEAAKASQSGAGLDPCMIACFFKKLDVINDEGKFDVEKAKAASAKLLKTPESVNQANDIADTCAAVNEKPTSDGVKGCERGALLLECYVKNRGAFSLL